MIRYRQGDVVLIRFPFSDLTNIKIRPAFIVSSDWYNDRRQDIIVLAISSKIPVKPMRDEFLIDKKRDLHASGLPKPSVIKLGKVMTLHKKSVTKVYGRLPEDTTRRIIKHCFDVLGNPAYIYVEKKVVEKILSEQEAIVRRLFGFEEKEKKKPGYYLKSPELDEVKIAEEITRLKTDVDWIKRLVWFIILIILWLLKINLNL